MTNREIVEMLRNAVGVPVTVLVAEVIAQPDERTDTVDVQPVGRAEMLDVRLKSAIGETDEGFVLYPERGSTVLVALIENDPDTAFVLAVSKVKKAKLIVNGVDFGKTLDSFFEALKVMTFTTPTGESKPATNLQSFLQLQQDFQKIFGNAIQ